MQAPSSNRSTTVTVNGVEAHVAAGLAYRASTTPSAERSLAQNLQLLLTQLEQVWELMALGDRTPSHGIPSAQADAWDDLNAQPTAITVIPRAGRESTVARGPVVVAVHGGIASIDALRWAFDEAVMRGAELEVVQTVRPDAPFAEMSSPQRDLAALLTDWRSDCPGLVVRIDVTRTDPMPLLTSAAAEAAVLVIGQPATPGLGSWWLSLVPRLLASSGCPLVLVPAARKFNHQGP